MPKDQLIILSLPFQRLIRSHYTPWLMETLTESADVVVVSPFAEEPSFRSAIPNPRVHHLLSPPVLEKLPWLSRKLIAVSTIMRMQGHWRIHQDYQAYLWENRHVQFGENGHDTFAPPHKRAVIDVLAWIGAWPRAWRWADWLVGRRSYGLAQLTEFVQGYKQVTLIQASSWGFQDQALAWMARTNRWRSILLPYTTDQLFCNGFLYCDYDAVCVQGSAEKRFAADLHALGLPRVVEFGSLYFHTMRSVLKSRPQLRRTESSGKRILFAGSIATYFPTEAEFACLDVLLEAVHAGILGDAHVTYRPFGQNPEIRRLIETRFANRSPKLSIRYADPAMFGLSQLWDANAQDAVARHVDDISGFDVAVMAGLTSLALDLSVLGTAPIAYLGDKSGVLAKRKAHLLLDPNGRYLGFEAIPVASDEDTLIRTVKQLLEDEVVRASTAAQIRDEWDYPIEDLRERISFLGDLIAS